MIQDRLMINDDKTKFLLVGTRQNLGSFFDSNLSMTDHINKACNAAFYHLHNLGRIKKYLSRASLKCT